MGKTCCSYQQIHLKKTPLKGISLYVFRMKHCLTLQFQTEHLHILNILINQVASFEVFRELLKMHVTSIHSLYHYSRSTDIHVLEVEVPKTCSCLIEVYLNTLDRAMNHFVNSYPVNIVPTTRYVSEMLICSTSKRI